MNLAALKYRNVLKEFGGPIERIDTMPVSIFGRQSYVANAFLVPGIVRRQADHELFGSANGSGESSSPHIARYKAISEAMERWAHDKLWNSPEGKRYGFDIDRTSSGLAAFPGLFAREARPGAYLEAVERLGIMAWWEGHLDCIELPHLRDGIQAFKLRHSAPTGEVVIVYRKSMEKGFHSYAHAAGTTVEDAQARAIGELFRTDYMLARRLEKGVTTKPKQLFERRCVFFSTEAGYASFRKRLERKADKPPIPWAPVFDGEIKGPWSKYATVWRVAHPMPSMAYLDTALTEYFFW